MPFIFSPACAVKRSSSKLRNYILTGFNPFLFLYVSSVTHFIKCVRVKEILDVNMVQLFRFKKGKVRSSEVKLRVLRPQKRGQNRGLLM